MYQLLKIILFKFDPEKVHYFSMNMLRMICRIPLLKSLLRSLFASVSSNPVNCMGLGFQNKIGLGAGFDKNALYLTELETLGFGFVEIGTVTPLPQSGNDKPRLFRLPKDKALINRMGFNNEGADAIARRLENWRNNNSSTKMIVGGNIGKNKITPNELAWQDYLICFQKLFGLVDYFVVNVSSPNTPGLRALQEKDSLKHIFSTLQEQNNKHPQPKPILLKIAPDLSFEQVDDIISLTKEVKVDGLIISNTTISREKLSTEKVVIDKIGAGGVSGKPVGKISTDLIRYVSEKTNNKLLIIGSGGVFNGADALEKLDAGAQLIQVWTGFIYEGPSIVKNINHHLSITHN